MQQHPDEELLGMDTNSTCQFAIGNRTLEGRSLRESSAESTRSELSTDSYASSGMMVLMEEPQNRPRSLAIPGRGPYFYATFSYACITWKCAVNRKWLDAVMTTVLVCYLLGFSSNILGLDNKKVDISFLMPSKPDYWCWECVMLYLLWIYVALM